MRFMAAVVALLALGACDYDNVHWKVNSNPSGTHPPGGGGGTVIVVVKSTLPPRQPTAEDPLENHEGLEGERDTVQVFLLTDVDAEDFVDGDAVLHGRSLLELETGR